MKLIKILDTIYKPTNYLFEKINNLKYHGKIAGMILFAGISSVTLFTGLGFRNIEITNKNDVDYRKVRNINLTLDSGQYFQNKRLAEISLDSLLLQKEKFEDLTQTRDSLLQTENYKETINRLTRTKEDNTQTGNALILTGVYLLGGYFRGLKRLDELDNKKKEEK